MSDAGDLIGGYFDQREKVFAYFGYVEDWRAIPLDDCRGMHWMIVGDDKDGTVVWSPDPFTEEALAKGETIFSGPIYTQRFLPKLVYRKEEFTMISVDTQTDGNKFLMVFESALECTDEKMKAAYEQHW